MGLRSQKMGSTIELTFTDQRAVTLNVAQLIRRERIRNREALETRIEEILTPQMEEGLSVQIAVRSVRPLAYAMQVYYYVPEIGSHDERGVITIRQLERPDRELIRNVRDND